MCVLEVLSNFTVSQHTNILYTQGHTPPGFQGKLVSEDPTNFSGGVRMFQIRGTSFYNTRAVQV